MRGPLRLEGALRPPGDKSIAHRALLLAALSRGACTLRHMPDGEDVGRTGTALNALGVPIERHATTWHVQGVGRHGFLPPRAPLDCGNSGTTMRLLCGLLAPQKFEALLVGDASLARRPMSRVAEPLRRMGARVECLGPSGRPPVRVGGQDGLAGVVHELGIDSAQVRAAILLAGLHAEGPTGIRPASASRDHTERMLAALGVRIEIDVDGLLLYPTLPEGWSGFDLDTPGDLSSALFAIVLAAVSPGSNLLVEHVGLNPGRRRCLEILREAGARIEITLQGESMGEPWGEVRVAGGRLRPLQLSGQDVVRCIDEIPALLAGWAAAGSAFRVRDAAELRTKESDRIAALAVLLRAFGARVVEHADGLELRRGSTLRPARVVSHGDHRIAMAAAVLGLRTAGESVIEDVACVRTSYPGFASDLGRLARPGQPAATRSRSRGRVAR